MSPWLVFSVIISYFGVLILISYLSGRKSDGATFFTANRKSPWYLVAFGMIGASLSGVTFISVPAWVGTTKFFYFQMVLGYMLGYLVIANILLPLYYRLNVVSIYSYLQKRFGNQSYKTGSGFFLLSRLLGSSARLFLVARVLQIFFFDAFHIPFAVTIFVTICLIWVYTFKAGIKTIVWTDTFQTFFMIAAVVLSFVVIARELSLDLRDVFGVIRQSDLSSVFNWEVNSKHFFFKQFFAGAFIAIAMTGLDQDMMQKNLTCKSEKDAKKNMYWFSISLIPINLLFMSLGVLLYFYATQKGIILPQKPDDLFPVLVFHHFSSFAGIIFLLGVTAAAFSSADSALTSLTTAFCVDFLHLDILKNDKKNKHLKLRVHIIFSILLFIIVLIFDHLNKDSVISAIFKIADYTYGPLLGMFAFGLFLRRSVYDKVVPFIAIGSPLLLFLLNRYSKQLFGGYEFGFELLIINGLFTFLLLLIFSKKNKTKNF